jgi:hypothetical protein
MSLKPQSCPAGDDPGCTSIRHKPIVIAHPRQSGSIYCILRHSTIAVTLMTLSIAVCGCSAGLGLWPVVQSHVPASGTAIVPLGETEGTASDFFFTWGGLPDFLHPALQEEAVREAIRVKGGDLLIDYTLSVRVTRFPLGLFLTELNAWWITWTAEGIAAKAQPEIREPAGQDIESPPASREMTP